MAGAAFVLRMIAALDTAPFMAGMKMMGATATKAGSALNTTLGAAAIGTAAAMFKSGQAAMEWEDQYAGVKRTIDTSDMSTAQATKTFDDLEGSLRNIGKQIPITHDEIASMAQIAGALGVPTDAIDEFTETAATLSKLSDDLSAEDSAFFMGKVRTIFGIDPEDLDNFASAIVDLGVKGASTEKEILSMATMAGGAMALFGAGPEDVLAFSSAFANVGVQAEAGGSAIQKMFLNAGMAISEGNKHLAVFAQLAGTTEEGFGELFRADPAQAILQVVQGLSRMEDPLEGLRAIGINQARWTRGWGSVISAEKQANAVTGELSESFVTANESMEDGTSIHQMAATRFDTTKASIDKLLFAFHDLGITIGDSLLPPIKFLADGLMVLVNGFNSLLQSVPGVTAVLGPLLAVLSSIIALRFGAKLLTLLLPMGPMGALLGNAWTGIFNTGILTPLMTGLKGLGVRFAAMLGIQLGGAAVTAAAAEGGAAAGAAFLGSAAGGGILGAVASGIAAIGGAIAIPVVWQATGKPIVDDLIRNSLGPESEAASQALTGDFVNNLKSDTQARLDESSWYLRWPWEAGGFFHQGEDRLADGTIDMVDSALNQQTFKSIADKVGAAWKGIGDMLPDAPKGGWDMSAAKTMLDELEGDVAAEGDEVKRTILDVASEIQSAWDVMSQKVQPPKMKSGEDRIQEGWQGIVQARKNLGRALKKNDPVAASFWMQRAAQLRGSIRKFKQQTGPIMDSAGIKFKDLKNHTHNWTQAIPPQIDEMNTGVQTGLTTTTNLVDTAVTNIKTSLQGQNYFTSGLSMVTTFASGITAGIPAVAAAAANAAAAAAGPLEAHSPPKTGPLRNIDRWGVPLIDAWLKPMRRRLNRVRATGNAIGSAFAPRPRLPAYGVGGAGRMGALGARGPVTIYKIGTLVADDNGIDELDRRIERRRRRRARARRLYNETD